MCELPYISCERAKIVKCQHWEVTCVGGTCTRLLVINCELGDVTEFPDAGFSTLLLIHHFVYS